MKYLRTRLLIVSVFTLMAGQGHAATVTQGEDLPTLVRAAVANNPELKSSNSRWQMFVGKIKQASSLEDPMLMFKLQNMKVRQPTAFDKDPQTARVIGISQQLPFWGKRALREETARYEAESYRWAVEERALELTRMVKETYYGLWAVDRELEIVDKNLKILSDFLTITESKYTVGQGVQQDIYKAGLEKSKMLDMQITLRQQRKSLEANLNFLLSRPSDTPVGTIADFSLPVVSLSAEQLNRIASDRRPQVKSFSRLIDKGETNHRLAEKEFWPDFNLSFEYMLREASMNDPGYDMYSASVTFNLPFQQERRRAMVAESSAETTMAREELRALNNSIDYTISDSLSQLERRRKLVELYRGGIIPQAEQSLESAVIGYRVNKVDFLTLLDGRMSLFNYERELYMSQAEYMMKLAQLEAAIGTDPTTAAPAAEPASPTGASPVAPVAHDHNH